MERYNI